MCLQREGEMQEELTVFPFPRNLEVIPPVRFSDALYPYNLTENTDSVWSPHPAHSAVLSPASCSNRIFELQRTETHSGHPKKVNYHKDTCELATGPEKLLRTKTG